MGRKKGYAREELIAEAMTLFHAHGFAGTSTQMLVEALGVNRNSMYAEFGSKQALFEAVLQRYDEQAVTDIFGALEAPAANLRSVAALFKRFGISAEGPASGLGCLMCNTAVEFAGAQSVGERVVPRYFDRVQAAFQHALENTRRAGGLAPGVQPAEESQFLTATALGIFVMVRARGSAKSVQAAVRGVARHLATLAPPPA